ncbi:MAG: FtsX-like permease family protein [Chitinophagales bacterium]|nr:FtsX-like permease family protein [Chitinophagales bacterium]MCZ2394324.1 FtsX-like permease family protein [Chitinophagales bacterium]
MNTSWYIAKQISQGSKKSFSRFIVQIAIFSTSLSIATMVVAICMANGFTKEIREKVFGFWGHIQIERFQNNNSYENSPITEDAKLLNAIYSIPEVKSGAPFINKAGIIKTKNAMEGIILKGVNQEYDWKFIQTYLVEGHTPKVQKDSTSREILISSSTAKRIEVKTGDALIIYFLSKDGIRPVGRKFKVAGLYHTGLEEYDTRFAIGDAKILQDINHWSSDQYSGYEVKTKDISNLPETTQKIYQVLPPLYNATSIRDIQSNIFDWLELLVKNEVFVLILMLIVALLNMTTALMILILDRTKMIGILKAIGATQAQIKNIFIYNAMIILGYSLTIGNLIALAICWLQQTFKIIKLDESAYYFKEVPVQFDWISIIGINLLTILITLLILLLPSMIISKISPLKAIRYD